MVGIYSKTPDKIFKTALIGWFDAYHVNGLNTPQPSDGSLVSSWKNLVTGNDDMTTYTMVNGAGSVTQPMIFELNNGYGQPHLKSTLTADKRTLRWICPTPLYTGKGCIIQIGKSYSFLSSGIGGNPNSAMGVINAPENGGYIWQWSLPYLSVIGAASYYSLSFRATNNIKCYIIANGTNITQGQWYGHLPQVIGSNIASGYINGQSNPIRFNINNAPHIRNISDIRKYSSNTRISNSTFGFGGDWYGTPPSAVEQFFRNLSATEFIYTNEFPTDEQMVELVGYIQLKYNL